MPCSTAADRAKSARVAQTQATITGKAQQAPLTSQSERSGGGTGTADSTLEARRAHGRRTDFADGRGDGAGRGRRRLLVTCIM